VRAGYRTTPSWKKPAVKRRRRRFVALLLLAGLVAVTGKLAAPRAVAALGSLEPFQVRSIDVSGLLYLAPEEIRGRIPVKIGDNLLEVDPGAVEAAIEKNARVERAEVARLPGKLRVRVTERRTFILVSAGSLLEVDAEGTVLTPLKRGLIADRPVVTGLKLRSTAPGTRLSGERVQDLLRLVGLLESPDVGLVSEISEIASDGPGRAVLRTSRDQIPIVVDPERATLAAMRAVAATLRDVRERDRRVLTMDARYRGQIVVRCGPDSSAKPGIDPRSKV
jgi:POTRA domain-containing FtsQ-type protein